MIVDFSLSREKLKHELRVMEYCSQLKAQRSSVNTRVRLDSLVKLIIFILIHFTSLLPFYFHRPVDCCFTLCCFKGILQNTTVPSSTLKKRHNALGYNREREAIAEGILHFFHIRSTENVADVLTKSMGPKNFYGHIKNVLFGARST